MMVRVSALITNIVLILMQRMVNYAIALKEPADSKNL